MKTAQEDTMAQTGAIAERGQVEAIQAGRCRVGYDMLDTTIRSRYRAVRTATSSLAASFSAEDQMVQSCPEASPMKWHQAHTPGFSRRSCCAFLADYRTLREEFCWLFNSYSTPSARRFRRSSCAARFRVRRSMRSSPFAHMWTK